MTDIRATQAIAQQAMHIMDLQTAETSLHEDVGRLNDTINEYRRHFKDIEQALELDPRKTGQHLCNLAGIVRNVVAAARLAPIRSIDSQDHVCKIVKIAMGEKEPLRSSRLVDAGKYIEDHFGAKS